MTAPDRSGFSLMEVLLATAILLGSVTVLGELAAIGRRHASSAEKLATAQRLCENKMNEILAGLASLEPIEEEPIELPSPDATSPDATSLTDQSAEGEEVAPGTESEQPVWLHSVEIEPLGSIGLVSVRVTVWQTEPTRDNEEQTDTETIRRGAFSLVRWMRDPFADESPTPAM